MAHSKRFSNHIKQSADYNTSIFEGVRFNVYDKYGKYKYSYNFKQICRRVVEGSGAVFGYNKYLFGEQSQRNGIRSDMRMYNNYSKVFDEIIILGARDFEFFKELYNEYLEG